MSGRTELIVKELLDRFGRTNADEAGIKLADRPGPLYRLLVLSTLPARLAAALVRVSLSQRAASEVTAAVPD